MIFLGNKVGRFFVPNFFHNKRAEDFKYLEYVGEYGPDNVQFE